MDFDQIADEIEQLSPQEIRARNREIRHLLGHRSIRIRSAAAIALGKIPEALASLHQALISEKNDLVISEICDVLAAHGYRESAPTLEQIAQGHKSQLARSYAVSAIASILGRDSHDFLLQRKLEDRSRRVIVTLLVELCGLGFSNYLSELLMALESRDYIVRIRAVGGLRRLHLDPTDHRRVLKALKDALSVEPTVAVTDAIEEAIVRLSKTHPCQVKQSSTK